MRADPNRLVAQTAALVARLTMFVGITVITFISSMGFLVMTEVIKAQQSLPDTASKLAFLRAAYLAGGVMTLTAWLGAMFFYRKLLNWSDLEQRDRFLKEQIERLSNRWDVLPF